MKKNYFYLLFIFLILLNFSCNDEEAKQYVPLVDKLPIASDDVISSTLETLLEIPVLTNDITGDLIVNNTLSIIGGFDTDANGTLDKLINPTQGTWTADLAGIITFSPTFGFVGNPTPIKYKGKDAQGNFSNEANIAVNAVPIVNFDVNAPLYQNLSDYKFFVGALKEQLPSLNVLPYEPASGLFTDYASKKRFVWMPAGATANFNTVNKVFDFPTGTVLIKTFYYKTIQPNNTTKMIETRLMIKKSDGWIFAEYIWNDQQNEATLLTNDEFADGSTKNITFKKPNDEIVTIDYQIPSSSECFACHKINEIATPIGLKPQNLNKNYPYEDGSKNQLQKLLEQGYINSYPSNIAGVVDYRDTSKSLEIRARSYLDANCAHCHQSQGRCSYTNVRFGFNETADMSKLGVCVVAEEPISATLTKIVTPGNIYKSIMHYRLNTNIQNKRMPLLGRTIKHDEGIQLIEEWISSLSQPCN